MLISSAVHLGRRERLTTTQGIDDILALLLALSWAAEDVEVCLISLTFGNVEVKRYH